MHVYVWEHIASLTTEPLNGCLRNLVGMKCSWPGKCIKMLWPYLPRGGSRARQNRSPGGVSPSLKNFFFRPEGYSNKPNS